jgi:Fungal specific transcription factor domain
MNMTLDTDNANGNDMMNGNEMMNGNDQMVTNEITEMSTILPSNDRQQPWFQDTWSLPFPHTPLNTSFPSDLHAGGLAQSAADPDERGRVESAFSAAAPEDASFLLPATNGPQVESLSSASRHDVDHGGRTVSSLSSQSPAYSRSSQDDHATGLHGSLNKESMATKRLIQVYFAEVHPYWPILHAPTFDTANASHVLVGSMIVLASWLEGEPDHMKVAPLVFDAVTATLLVRDCFPCGLIEND